MLGQDQAGRLKISESAILWFKWKKQGNKKFFFQHKVYIFADSYVFFGYLNGECKKGGILL